VDGLLVRLKTGRSWIVTKWRHQSSTGMRPLVADREDQPGDDRKRDRTKSV